MIQNDPKWPEWPEWPRTFFRGVKNFLRGSWWLWLSHLDSFGSCFQRFSGFQSHWALKEKKNIAWLGTQQIEHFLRSALAQPLAILMERWEQRILGSAGPHVGLGSPTLGAFGFTGLSEETLKMPPHTITWNLRKIKLPYIPGDRCNAINFNWEKWLRRKIGSKVLRNRRALLNLTYEKNRKYINCCWYIFN